VWFCGLAFIGLYMVVYVEARHIAGALLLLSLASIALMLTKGSGWATASILVLIAASALSIAPRLGPAAHRVIAQRGDVHDDRWKVAEEFARLGLPPRTPVASIAQLPFDDWAYPAQARVVSEIVGWNNGRPTGDIEAFWKLGQDGRRRVLELMRAAGARILVCNSVPADATTDGWTRIPDSRYYYIDLRSGVP
jgi:hypothetical protein